MKKSLVFATVLTLALMTTAAMADPIDVRYNTHVSSGLCPQNSSGFCTYYAATNTTTYVSTDTSDGDTVTLTYYGVGNFASNVYNDAYIGSSGIAGAQLGQFGISTTDSDGDLSTASKLLDGAFFNIQIDQILPSSGTGTVVANLTGTLSVAPDGAITFNISQDHVTIGSIIYKTTADSYGLNNSSGQLTSIDGTVTTPEPASLALLGSGMLGLAGTIRRKLKA